MLLLQPLEELPKTNIGENALNGVESVPQLVMAPGLVDEIFARMTRGNDFCSALAARNDMMAASWHRAVAENALRILKFDAPA